jgi:hypothetical protein
MSTYLMGCRGVMMDMSLKGTSVEPDLEDIGNCYGANVSERDMGRHISHVACV